MRTKPPLHDHSALCLGLAVGGAFLGLIVILATQRPEMIGVALIRNLVVGFDL